jgi:phosphatidylserine/phosphatidylglycerophosphate/cardiolipin synthase-like enzyme
MTAALSSAAALTAAVAGGRDVALAAYVLWPGSSVEAALERAGDRGAHVSVTLEGHPYRGGRGGGSLSRSNRRVAAALRRHGVAVRLTRRGEAALHLKAAVVDGTAYFDDRNWTGGGDTIVTTSDARAVAATGAALRGGSGVAPPDDLALEKARALRLEARAIRSSAGDRLDVQSESFGYSPVYDALLERAAGGAHVRLLVAAREFAGRAHAAERSAVRRLRAAGVDVRLAAGDEKFCVGGDRGWVGSANATFPARPMRDWGLQTRDPAMLGALETRFASAWAVAEPVRA